MKKYVAAPVALLAGVALAIPMASGASLRATTVITQCPNGVTPPSAYCSVSTITTPDPVTNTAPSGEVTTTADGTGEPLATPEQKAAGQAAADDAVRGATTYVGQVGNTLVYAVNTPKSLSSDSDDIVAFVIYSITDGTYTTTSTLYLHASQPFSKRAVAAAHTNPLVKGKGSFKAGQTVVVKTKLTKTSKSAVKRAAAAKLLTTMTVADSYGTHKTSQLTSVKLKKKS